MEDPQADKALQTQSCAGCHRKQIESHRRFKGKAIEFEKLDCYTCHDVHQLQPSP